jgi:predicted DCC family thiol-disulfide oxidoreductase YuxK
LPLTDPPLVPQRLLEEMHLVTPDQRRVYHGYGAFRWMAWRMPLLWITAPLLYIPGVPWLGQRIYLWVARNRFKIIPCRDGACHLPPPRDDDH